MKKVVLRIVLLSLAAVFIVCVGAFHQSGLRQGSRWWPAYQSIAEGAVREEIEATLGPGTVEWDGAPACGIRWRSDNGMEIIGVRFQGGRAVSKYYAGGVPWWRHRDGRPWK